MGTQCFSQHSWFEVLSKSINEAALINQIISNQIKYSGIIKRLKPYEMLIKVSEEVKEVKIQERPCYVQQSLESVKCGSIDQFDWVCVPRDVKSRLEGCFLPEQTGV